MPEFPLRHWKQDVLETAADRFERRLTEESAGLRIEMARIHGSLIKWMFAFWIGQLGITLTIVGVVLRAVRLL